MKKTLLVLVSLLVVGSLFASGTRVATMGDISFGDASEVGTYPGLRTNFTNYFWSSMGTVGADNDYKAGIVLDLGPGVFGLNLNGEVTEIEGTNINLQKSLSLQYGIKLNSLNLGANIVYGSDMYEDNSAIEEASIVGFGFGVSNSSLDFGFNYKVPGYNYDVKEGDDRETKRFSELDASFRYLPFELFGFNIIPEIKLEMEKEALDTENTDGEDTDLYTINSQAVIVDAIIGYDLSKETKVLFDIQLFGMGKILTEYDEDFDPIMISTEISQMGPLGTWKIGMESKIKPWLTGRCGAIKNYSKTMVKNDYRDSNDTEDIFTDEEFELTFGLGFTFGKFIIDANFNEELLFAGPNFISGETNGWASALSVTYLF